jgi:UDP-hydrolysing UDP-N-acetyl-D-glucosamine 2-epimerase
MSAATPAAKRRIAVVTGSRAEYGLMRWLMELLRADPAAELLLIVTGTHLSHEHGHTVDEIAADGFSVAARVPVDVEDDSAPGVARAVGAVVAGVAAELERLEPDLLVLLGDRYETFAAAAAATIARVPIAHLHGGETTEGAFDEALRHSITKMSHLHFAAAEPYRRRIVQLGEDPERVWDVGALGVDALDHITWLTRVELEDRLGGFDLGDRPLVVTYHPATLAVQGPEEAIAALTSALDAFPEHQVVVTGTNADPDRDVVERMVAAWASAQPSRVKRVTSLGQQAYLSLLALAGAAIGNSSSGIIEAPSLGVPTVNLGDRQAGRLRAPSVLDCAEEHDAVVAAIGTALGRSWPAQSPFGTGGAAAQIAEILVSHPLEGILRKRFFDQ